MTVRSFDMPNGSPHIGDCPVLGERLKLSSEF